MASDYVLKIDGIKGESTDSKHKDEIEIESFSWGATQPGSFASGGGGGAGKVSFQDIHFTIANERGVSQPDARLRQRAAHQGGHADGAQGREGAAGVPTSSSSATTW